MRRAKTVGQKRIAGCMRLFLMFASCTWLSIGSSESRGATPVIDRIEEDWEMRIIDPSPEVHSPQVTFFVFPVSQEETNYFQMQMNYAARDIFSGGGFHVAAVRADTYVDQARSGTRRGLSITEDVITWTSVMACMDGNYLFAVKDGYCTDWGQFGGPEYLVQMSADGAQSLASYDPVMSLESVDIGFGGNRVASIELKTVRIYYANSPMVSIAVNQLVSQ